MFLNTRSHARTHTHKQITPYQQTILNTTFKRKLSQFNNLFNGQIKYYLKIYTFDLSLNVPYITIYITTMFHILTIFVNK